ncbi:carbohydrate esterase family 3 protein [Apiospora arundinis]
MIPTSWSDATIESVNSAIPGWASQHSTASSPIVVADCSRAAGFTNAMLQQDGVHPNDQGDQFIAQQVGPKLIQAIKAVQGGGGSAPVATATTTTAAAGGAPPRPPRATARPCMRSAAGMGGRARRAARKGAARWLTNGIRNAPKKCRR